MQVSTTLSIPEINELLKLPLLELISLANQSRAEIFGSNFELCSIINAKSGLCSQDCIFQGLVFMANGMFTGGYLTMNGREVEEDQRLVEEVIRAWQN